MSLKSSAENTHADITKNEIRIRMMIILCSFPCNNFTNDIIINNIGILIAYCK